MLQHISYGSIFSYRLAAIGPCVTQEALSCYSDETPLVDAFMQLDPPCVSVRPSVRPPARPSSPSVHPPARLSARPIRPCTPTHRWRQLPPRSRRAKARPPQLANTPTLR